MRPHGPDLISVLWILYRALRSMRLPKARKDMSCSVQVRSNSTVAMEYQHDRGI
jgi:hypothetical protein